MTAPLDPVARWDERYAGRDYLWDVGPNQFVEHHLADVTPGTAIDLAAGEGRNAVWLARRGWAVAAVDFSQAGLDKAARLAADHGVAEAVTTIRADALTWEPAEPVDLVVIAYLQLPVEQVRVALEHAASWLRPGGRLLVVAHDRTNIEHGYGGPSDRDSLLRPRRDARRARRPGDRDGRSRATARGHRSGTAHGARYARDRETAGSVGARPVERGPAGRARQPGPAAAPAPCPGPVRRCPAVPARR